MLNAECMAESKLKLPRTEPERLRRKEVTKGSSELPEFLQL